MTIPLEILYFDSVQNNEMADIITVLCLSRYLIKTLCVCDWQRSVGRSVAHSCDRITVIYRVFHWTNVSFALQKIKMIKDLKILVNRIGKNHAKIYRITKKSKKKNNGVFAMYPRQQSKTERYHKYHTRSTIINVYNTLPNTV